LRRCWIFTLGDSCSEWGRKTAFKRQRTVLPELNFPSDARNIFACAPLANFSSVFKALFGLFGVAGLYVSKGRPLVWWYGGVKVALRINSRDASDFAKQIDSNI